MGIGKLLKKYRLEQGKTQAEFVGKIIDRSYYAKIEKGLHQINAIDLINLLNYNEIDMSSFYSQLNEKYESYKEQILQQRKLMEQAYYNVDIDQMKKIKTIMNSSRLSKRDQEMQNLLVDGFLELLNTNGKPNFALRKKLKEKIFDIPTFNPIKLMLYCNSMRFYTLSDNKIIAKRLVKKYKKDENMIVEKDLLSIVINILIFSIEKNDLGDVEYYFSYVDSIPTIPDIYFYKDIIQFLECLIRFKQSGNSSFLKMCDVIIEAISISGMRDYSLELSKFKNKYQK
ncbi:MAG: helix-turn-helix domain-containing protein [Lactobacillus helveticus]